MKWLIVLSLLTVIYMNDDSYVYVERYKQWNREYTFNVHGAQNTALIPIGVKYWLDGHMHYVPYSSIKEIVE